MANRQSFVIRSFTAAERSGVHRHFLLSTLSGCHAEARPHVRSKRGYSLRRTHYGIGGDEQVYLVLKKRDMSGLGLRVTRN